MTTHDAATAVAAVDAAAVEADVGAATAMWHKSCEAAQFHVLLTFRILSFRPVLSLVADTLSGTSLELPLDDRGEGDDVLPVGLEVLDDGGPELDPAAEVGGRLPAGLDLAGGEDPGRVGEGALGHRVAVHVLGGRGGVGGQPPSAHCWRK